jgi:CelD/BcsL family acetyltransferase involved in cellulose biosynthesis
MRIELQRDPSLFDALHDEWNALLEKSVSRVPFLRAEYQRAWWAHRGGGEWPQAQLLVAVGRTEAGDLAGVAPLFFARNRDGRPALLLVGSIEISDYLDLILPRAHAEAFCAALLDRLTQPDVPGWEVLDLYNLPASSPTRAALGRAAAARSWSASESLLEPVPAIALPGDWDTYLATMVEKKERQEIRRKLRRAGGGEDKVAWYVVSGAHDIAAETEAFLRLMELNADKARFLTPEMRAQFAETIRAAHAGGWLHLSFLTINHQRAAAYLSFDFANRLWIYNSALDPRFNALSPGWVLLGLLLRWAIENKRAAFDFLRGDEDYKIRFGGVAGKIYRVQISRDLPIGALGGEPASLRNEFEADFFPPP